MTNTSSCTFSVATLRCSRCPTISISTNRCLALQMSVAPLRSTQFMRLARRGYFLWRTRTPHDYDRHDLTAQRRLIHSLYGDMGWELPRLLTKLDKADDLYLDSISTIVMDTWTRGRVTLVGDAGYSPALRSAAEPASPSSARTSSPRNWPRRAAITFADSRRTSRPYDPPSGTARPSDPPSSRP